MSILFIADVHLCDTNPKIVNGFLNFLNHHAVNAQALYILGDLFKIWLGDDVQSLLHTNVAQNLKILNKKKIPCYFICGNRDFLLGSQYADLCGMTLLNEYQTLKLPSGKNIIVLHGDTLCTNDKSYQRFRKILRNHIFQKIFLSFPKSIRSHIFNHINNYCMYQTQYKKSDRFNINSQTITDILIQNQSDMMIHGHTHKTAIHNIYFSKTTIFRQIVLGSWGKYGSVVELDEKNNSFAVIKFPLNVKKLKK